MFKLVNQSEIHVEVFMIRWIKCLLSREFELAQLAVVWDHLFREFFQRHSFDLLFQSVQLAMFLQVKEIGTRDGAT